MWAFTGISLFLVTLLAFVIMLHFGMAAALLGREIVPQMPSFFLSAVPVFLRSWGELEPKTCPVYCSLNGLLEDELLLPWWEPPARAFEQSLWGHAPLAL